MLDLAEDTLERTPLRRWLGRAVIAAIVIALALALAVWLKDLIGSPAAAKRQVAKISILPDTPPPPPPPPKPDRKPEPPKDEPKQAMREQPPKAPDAPKPAEAPLKMEGAAGDGPSAFAAGPVGEEYKGGTPVIGAAASGGGSGTASDRAQERFYANTARQLLRDEIEKHLKPEAGEVVATFAIWIEPSGRIQKIELLPGSSAATDTDLRAALDETSRRLQLPQHNGLTQPLRFRLSMRAAG